MKTMRDVANALNCHLVYGFIPKTSFHDIVEKQARTIAKKRVERTSHTMRLEDQPVDSKWEEAQIEYIAQQLLQHAWRYLWNE